MSSKIGVLEALIDKCDKVLIGGGMIFTFYKARGLSVVRAWWRRTSSSLPRSLRLKRGQGCAAAASYDVVLADNFAPDANRVSSIDAIPDGWMGLDIGPDDQGLPGGLG